MATSQPAERRRVVLVGIGVGDPEHLTLGAVRALNAADAVFLVDKGRVAEDLRAHRRALPDAAVERFPGPRLVERTLTAVRDPARSHYAPGVAAWRADALPAPPTTVAGVGSPATR